MPHAAALDAGVQAKLWLLLLASRGFGCGVTWVWAPSAMATSVFLWSQLYDHVSRPRQVTLLRRLVFQCIAARTPERQNLLMRTYTCTHTWAKDNNSLWLRSSVVPTATAWKKPCVSHHRSNSLWCVSRRRCPTDPHPGALHISTGC